MYSFSSVFVFCVLFFLRRLQNAALIAALQEPLPPLQLTEEAVVEEFFVFLDANPRLRQAVVERLCLHVPSTPETQPRPKRHNDNPTPPLEE